MTLKTLNTTAMETNLIIYDGECGFCNKAMLFIAKNDTKNEFKFVSNTSVKGSEILMRNQLTELSKQTIIVVENNRILIKGEAVKQIAKKIELNFFLKKLIALSNENLVDFVYTIIAKNRLLLSDNKCAIPSKEIREKFIF